MPINSAYAFNNAKGHIHFSHDKSSSKIKMILLLNPRRSPCPLSGYFIPHPTPFLLRILRIKSFARLEHITNAQLDITADIRYRTSPMRPHKINQMIIEKKHKRKGVHVHILSQIFARHESFISSRTEWTSAEMSKNVQLGPETKNVELFGINQLNGISME